jgi:hypothetical protein
MGQVNWGRVLLGGLAAGLVINAGEMVLNLVVFADQMQLMQQEMGLEPPSAIWMVIYILLGFAGGAIATCLYAAMRPRFGPGPRTALIAGGTVWFLAWFWPMVSMAPFFASYFALSAYVMATVYTFIEVQVAALVGGWLYQEVGEPAM